MTDQENDYERERAARYRKLNRAKYASMIYRDAVSQERHRHVNSDMPMDFKALACESVEAAEALLDAMDDKPVDLPEYGQ